MEARLGCAMAGVAAAAVIVGQMRAGEDPDTRPHTGGGASASSDAHPGGGARSAQGSVGIDIAASRIGLVSTSPAVPADDFWYYGTSGGIRAFSMASTACNVGDQLAQWQSGGAGNHPVVAQNMFRYLGGRFEQIGQSWLKHTTCAVSENSCGACQFTNCSTLGIGCADTYWATLNDGASGGPKSQINPLGLGSGGTHTHPYPSPSGPLEIRGRLQIADSDINAGGLNFAEIQYVTHDEPIANRHNNASWREVDLALTSISGVAPGQESVHFQEPAIMAWAWVDQQVVIESVDVPGDGRFYLGYRAMDLGGGTWTYEYALQNLNSVRSVGSFAVPVPAGVSVTAPGFHDVDYHSGEPSDGTDWPVANGGGQVVWSTESEAENPNANAIRWGTLYNFRFQADGPPAAANIEIGLFTAGSPASVTVTAIGPSVGSPCPTDVNDDGVTNLLDLIDLLLCFGLPAVPGCESADVNTDGSVNVVDLIGLLLEFGTPCP